MIKGALTLPQTDYSGGLNAAQNPLVIKENETPDCLNVHSNVFGSVERRLGYTKLNSSAVSGAPTANGSLDHIVSPSSRKILTVWGATLHKMDDLDGTWDAITMTVTIGSGRAELRQYLGKAILASHVSGNVQSWTSGDAATATISGSAAFKYIWPDDITGRLWACGLANFDGVAYYTPVNTLSFDTTNDKIQVTNTDILLGFRTLKGRLYAFGQKGWYRIDDLGGTPRFGARFVAHPGTNSPESVQAADILGVGEGLVYLDTDKKLRFFDGTDTAILSYKFHNRSTFSAAHTINRISASRLSDVHAVVWPTRNWYMLFYSEDSGATNNNVLIYDLTNRGAWPLSGIPCNSAMVAQDANNALKLLYGGYTGYTWNGDTGNDDDGSAINSHYELSRKPAEQEAGRRGLIHKWRQISLVLKATGNYTIALKAKMEFGTGYTTLKNISLRGTGAVLGEFILGTDVLGGSEAILDVIGIDRIGKYCTLRLESGGSMPPWQLFGDEVTARALGIY